MRGAQPRGRHEGEDMRKTREGGHAERAQGRPSGPVAWASGRDGAGDETNG